MTDCCGTRRRLLHRTACGFGGMAFHALLSRPAARASELATVEERRPPFAARAKRVIFIFMQGGPSHIDTFDYKPELIRNDGKQIDFTGVRFGDFGQVTRQKLMKPLWKFRPYGECGRQVSDLFPHIGRQADDLCFLHGLHTEGVAHGPATLFLHTGAINLVRPSVGSWVVYGLGTENHSLPGFVSLMPSEANGGPRNYSNAFLPDVFQGSAMGLASRPMDQMKFANVLNEKLSSAEAEARLRLVRRFNAAQIRRRDTADHELDAVMRSFELAARMQSAAPEVVDLSSESAATLQSYGVGEKDTDAFGRQCLVARRLAEAGVRFVQVNYADESTNPRWDQHSNMPRHAIHARATDQPVAALIADLKQRGLLEDTLVWWGGEFGRTPFSQGSDGRDHNPRGFTVFLAGGGVRSGISYGETDDIGHLAVSGKVHMRDLHATLLHLLGLNHEGLTYRHAGRDFRLTDLAGEVIHDIIA